MAIGSAFWPTSRLEPLAGPVARSIEDALISLKIRQNN